MTHHRVTPQGIAMGKNAVRLEKLGRALLAQAGLNGVTGNRLRAGMCKTCACQPGSVPNGCLQTQMDFLKSAVEGLVAMAEKIRDMSRMKPSGQYAYTKHQWALIERFKQEMGGMYPSNWKQNSADEIADAAIKAVLEYRL